jgi:glutamate transport system substrate-binding protein
VIVGTYSITDARKEKVSFAGPYFIAGQDLLVRADDTSITGVDTPRGKKLCSVKGSTSATNVQKKVPGRQPAGVRHLHPVRGRAQGQGNVDALTTDDTILAGYAAQEANKGKLKVVGKTFSKENYGVGLKKGDTAFCRRSPTPSRSTSPAVSGRRPSTRTSARRATSPARQPAHAGRLRLTQTTTPVCRPRTSAGGIPPRVGPPATPEHGRRVPMGELFAQYNVSGAFGITDPAHRLSAVGALLIGTSSRSCGSPVPSSTSRRRVYVNLVRNTPADAHHRLLQHRVHRQPRDVVQPTTSPATTSSGRSSGLSVYHAAFVCEALRSGVNTVPAGQAEAARSIGLTFGQSLREVLLPQAFRGAITPLGNTLIALTKNTTVAAAIGVAEISGLMKEMMEFRPTSSRSSSSSRSASSCSPCPSAWSPRSCRPKLAVKR